MFVLCIRVPRRYVMEVNTCTHGTFIIHTFPVYVRECIASSHNNKYNTPDVPNMLRVPCYLPDVCILSTMGIPMCSACSNAAYIAGIMLFYVDRCP
jgi:hypothetical protein